MNREEQLASCRICMNRQPDSQEEYVCKLTGAPANFENYCPDMVMDYEEENRLVEGRVNIYARRDRASQGQRLGTYLIDRVAIIVCALILGFVLGIYIAYNPNAAGFLEDDNKLQQYLVGFLISYLYYAIFEAVTGKTIGKMIIGTRVIDETGNHPDFSTVLLRTLCRFIPFEVFSFLSEDANGWHDSLSKTTVIKVKKK